MARKRRKWNKETVIAAIQERNRQGLPLTRVRRDDSGLESAGHKWFGTWRSAVVAAGLTSTFRRTWSKMSVVRAIQDRHQKGKSMATTWEDDKGLYLAARRRFGSWQNALSAAGLPTVRRRKWSQERIVALLREYECQNVANIRTYDKGLASAITKYFGTLRKARLSAGLEGRRKRWSKQRIIEAIQDHYVRGNGQRTGWSHSKLRHAAIRRFGGWRNALVAAGVVTDRSNHDRTEVE